MPPPNTSFATAVDLGVLPADVTIDVHDAGVNYTVYYKFTAPASSIVIGAWGFSAIAETYRATLKPYLGPAGAPTQILAITSSNKPIQFPVVAGSEYFLEFTKNGDTSPASLRVRVEVAPHDTITAGSILVNDDRDGAYTAGFPLVVLSSSADNTALNFVKNIVPGESADSVNNGNMLFEDRQNGRLVLYDRNFNILNTVTYGVGVGFTHIRTNRSTNKFWVERSANPAIVKSYSDSLVEGVTTYTLTGTSGARIAASPTETILYYVATGTNQPIKRWDLINNIARVDLVAGIVDYQSNDILGLSDGSILVNYYKSSTGENFIRQYSAAGATIRTFTLSTIAGSFTRLAYALDHPDSFWAWQHNSAGTSGVPYHFYNIRVGDGTVLTTRQHTAYVLGVYLEAETATPTGRFGGATSCPLLITRVASVLGLLKIVPNKRDDHNGTATVAIPSPTFKTALLP